MHAHTNTTTTTRPRLAASLRVVGLLLACSRVAASTRPVSEGMRRVAQPERLRYERKQLQATRAGKCVRL